MKRLLCFPNGYKVDISDKPIEQSVNSVYDAGWIMEKKLAMKEWVINAKLHQDIDGEDRVTIFLEEAHVSKNFNLSK